MMRGLAKALHHGHVQDVLIEVGMDNTIPDGHRCLVPFPYERHILRHPHGEHTNCLRLPFDSDLEIRRLEPPILEGPEQSIASRRRLARRDHLPFLRNQSPLRDHLIDREVGEVTNDEDVG
jgi:hypothetical protein